MGGGWWCCCQTGCTIIEDDFDRTDNTNIGPLWVEVGDCEIFDYAATTDGKLKITSGSATTVDTLSDPDGSFAVDVTLFDPSLDDSYEIHMLWDGVNPGVKVRLTAPGSGDPACWKTEIWTLGDGWYADDVELINPCGTIQLPFIAGTDQRVYITYDHSTIRVNDAPTPISNHYELWRCEDPPAFTAATKIALVNPIGASQPIAFNDFSAFDHRVYDPTCPYWGCYCGAI